MCCRSAWAFLTQSEPQCITVQSPLDPELSHPSKAQMEVQGPRSAEKLAGGDSVPRACVWRHLAAMSGSA